MTDTMQATTTLAVEVCCKCGMTFGLPNSLQTRLRRTHDGFYCPHGHRQYYFSESDVEQANRKLQQERAAHDQTRAGLRDTERSLRATKGVVTRTKRRIANGVCPCCKRSFANVKRHMEKKHPEYAD